MKFSRLSEVLYIACCSSRYRSFVTWIILFWVMSHLRGQLRKLSSCAPQIWYVLSYTLSYTWMFGKSFSVTGNLLGGSVLCGNSAFISPPFFLFCIYRNNSSSLILFLVSFKLYYIFKFCIQILLVINIFIFCIINIGSAVGVSSILNCLNLSLNLFVFHFKPSQSLATERKSPWLQHSVLAMSPNLKSYCL